MRKTRDWREVIFQELIILGFVSAAVLILADWLFPETRLRALGLFLEMLCCTAWVVRGFKRLVVATWEAGGRARERQMQLEQGAERRLSVVRRVVPTR